MGNVSLCTCICLKDTHLLRKLAIIFGVTKFHIYLYGRHFTIHSDHQPFKHIFGDKKGIPPMAVSRIQRWALTLSAYEYTIEYCPGNKLQNADALSPLPLNRETHVPLPGDIRHLQRHLNTRSPVTADQISAWTEKDPYREDGLPEWMERDCNPMRDAR